MKGGTSDNQIRTRWVYIPIKEKLESEHRLKQGDIQIPVHTEWKEEYAVQALV